MPRFDVTIAGELNLDVVLYGLPAALPPERELLAQDMVLTLGSSSAIVAHNLSMLGTRVGFQSRIGDDALGQIALDCLAQGGVDVSLVRRVAGPIKSGLTIVLQRNGWRNVLTYPGTIADLHWSDLDLEYLSDARHFHFCSFYLQHSLRPDVPKLFQSLKARGLTISLDTNDDPDDLWQGGLRNALQHVDIFMPNAREACRVAGTDDLESAMSQLAELVPILVVKLGRKGAVAIRSKERFSSPAVGVQALDPVGAGDSFNAGFLHQYLLGADLPTCLVYGNLAGAFSTTRAGGTEAFRDQEHRKLFFREHATDQHVQPR